MSWFTARRLTLASLLTIAAGANGCVQVEPDDDTLGITDDAVTQASAQCADAKTDADHLTLTSARVKCLNEIVAPRFLQLESARRSREVASRDPAAAQAALTLPKTYTMRVDEGACYDESINPWWSYAHDIGTDDLPELVRQLRYSALFLGQLHMDLEGAPNIIFHTLAHCPYDVRSAYLLSEGPTLHVGVNKDWGTVVPYTDVQLRKEWASGSHMTMLPAKMKAMWPLLDPAGTARTALRRIIRRDVSPFAARIRGLVNGVNPLGDDELRSELMAAADTNTLTGLKMWNTTTANHVAGEPCTSNDPDCRDIRHIAKDVLLGGDRRTLERFAERWASFASDPENVENIAAAVVGAQHVVNQNEWDIERVQLGLVNVANLHNIEVDVRVLIGDAARFSRYLLADRPQTQTQRIRSFQIGLVNTDTVDWVNVKLHIGADRGLQSAGLEDALRVALQPTR